ncbi:7TM-DISM domain-containing protein [Oceanicoccus sp. KOV_DT_Chl]|uniref:7TMR-DISMED2 domain-containing protein n=1 Tax=Oceanicoccus sp. KOV_DT_Chl TaxID=1904639 RepID=UPI001357730B|nr:7TM-DISM domain-containing protein [Oceanicoccus sp. KOV_DT_Chl]
MTLALLSVRCLLLALLFSMPAAFARETLPTLELQSSLADTVRPELVYWQNDTEPPIYQPGQELDVASMAPWQPLPELWDTPRYNTNNVWFAFSITNASSRIRTLMLAYNYARMDEMDLYLVKNNIVQERWITGSERPWESRAIPNANFVFPVTLSTGDSINVVIRTTGRSSYFPKYWSVSDIASWQRYHELTQLPSLIALGFMLCIIVYSAVLLHALRTVVSLCAFIYLVALTLLLLWISGNVWLISPEFNENNRLAAIAVGTAISAMVFLLIDLLEMRKTFPRIARLLTFYTVIYFATYLFRPP